MAIVITGVSGSGKSSIGKRLAKAMHCDFYEGDDYHSPANKAKMHAGIPLTDGIAGRGWPQFVTSYPRHLPKRKTR